MVHESQAAESREPSQPGPTRTWWHPLLARTLAWLLDDAFEVRDEVSVGVLPLRIDVVLFRRPRRRSPPANAELLPRIVQRCKRCNLLEYKSPTDAFEAGDLEQFLGRAHLFRSQNQPSWRHSDTGLFLLAPRVSRALRDDARRLGGRMRLEETGLWSVTGLAFPTWVVELDRVAGPHEPVLTLFSRVFLRDPWHIMENWRRAGHAALFDYVIQQVVRIDSAEERLKMIHKDPKELEELRKDIVRMAIERSTVEERLKGVPLEERLKGVPLEERLKGVPLEERLKGVPLEERLKGVPLEELAKALSKKERQRLKKVLEQED